MTLLIILVTSAVSVYAFYRPEIFWKLKLNAFRTVRKGEWYRILTHGFVHADWSHLIFNMLSLYFFGGHVAYRLNSAPLYLLLYLGGIAFAVITTLARHKDHEWYNSVGASGGVSAVVFASILFAPLSSIYIFFIPIGIPAFLYGVAFIWYSHYMSRKDRDNINHDAHLLGAVYGFFFPLIINPAWLGDFIYQIVSKFRM